VISKSSPAAIRLVLLLAAIILIALVALFALSNFGDNTLMAPTPTLKASAVAVNIAPTAATPSPESVAVGQELPATNTPEATTTGEPTPLATANSTPTKESTPISAVPPTASPTSLPQLVPTLATLTGTRFFNGNLPAASTAIPSPVPMFDVPLGTTNILLLGSDIGLNDGIGRTDTMIILAINRDGPTASMVSLPRDLYVYIPGWTMNRLNTALSRGSSSGYPGGAIAQIKDTILYNFGVPIHYYARVDFGGFKQSVDIMDGVDVAVSCQLRDWRLKSPDLDPDNEDNWEMFTLERGIHHMDGDMALWYARSRLSTSDFDRGRRQQQLLRSMLNQGVDLDLVGQAPELWGAYKDTVETNMDVGRMLQLASLAPAVRENGIQHLYIVGNQLQPWTVPNSGAAVQLPVWENMQDTFQRLFLPPALNRASRPPVTVEVLNSTSNPDLPLLAADNLAWYGFEPVINNEDIDNQSETTVEYFGQNFKGSFDWLLSWIFDKRTADIELVTDTVGATDYRIVLGNDYDPCRPQLFAPQIFVSQ
jgi:LCP family protein required for cell wall assembly